jgi:asparagine synthase (glutamine-hydrolysing)
MCGIAGVWGTPATAEDAKLVDRMMASLAHRGPDAAGKLANEHGTLGHRRLSIMDPAGGDQPIRSDTGRAIVGNGEIYNFPEIRRSLAGRYCFHTGSDTEAALHLYDAEGVTLPTSLDGMFAFVIADGKHLYAARDPVGIKPLYVAEDDGRLQFASELKAFPSSVSRAQEFRAGTWFHSETGFRPYYELPEHGPNPQSQADPDALALAVRATIEDAVQKRLMSDVPVGAFLSGGLDSGVVTAIARQHVSELHTFSVGFAGSDDLEAARYLSRILDTVHHEYVLNDNEILAKLPEILYHLESFDLDLVRSAIPCYFTARLASHYVKVILTGEGADELFAGYAYYKDYTNRAKTLQDELRRSVGSMHDINLQRVDRMTMAHSVEGRVPFLDLSMIDLAFRIPAELKLYPAPAPKATEKWILREACEDLLPAEILWRRKAQFDEGSGIAERMGAILRGYIADVEPGAPARNSEEQAYFDIFVRQFSNPHLLTGHVRRWADESSRL